MYEYIIEYIFALLDVVFFTFIVTITNEKKIRDVRIIYLAPIICSILLFISGFIPLGILSTLSSYLILFLLIFSLVKDKVLHILFIFLSLFISLSILDMLTVTIMTTVLGVTLEECTTVLYCKVLVWSVSRFALYLIFPKINFYFDVFNILKGKSRYSLVLFSLFDLIILVLGYMVYYSFYNINFSVFIVVMLFSIVLFNILLNNLLKKINEINKQEKEWERKETMYLLRLNNIEQEYQYVEHFHREKHDFNQHLQMILAYINIDNLTKAKEYIFMLNKKIDNLVINNTTKYPEIFSFIQYKLNIAAENGIEVEKLINLPDNLLVEILDLTVIIGNIIDNAIEANKVLTKKMLALKIYEKNDYLIINTQNPYKEIVTSDDNQFITTKEDKSNHGIGLQNIQFIVDKYNGFMEIDTSNNIFIIKVALENAEIKLAHC